MKWKGFFPVIIMASLSYNIVSAEMCTFNNSIGLADGTFGERGLIATSFFDLYHTPNWARLNQPRAWAPALLNDISRSQEFVQITFLDGEYLVTGLVMQGSPLEDWWVTKFHIATSNDGINFYRDPEEYDGNSDKSSVVMVTVQNPKPSVYFRIIPTGWNNHIALRLELYGCDNFSA